MQKQEKSYLGLDKDKESYKSQIKKEDLDCEIVSNDISFYDFNFKINFIGDSGVGKSCIITKALKNIFSDIHNGNLGFEFYTLNLKFKEKIVKLQIWDICGKEIYGSLLRKLYENSSLIFLVYSIDRYFLNFIYFILFYIILSYPLL
jgi:GTPase SAR1 family protein